MNFKNKRVTVMGLGLHGGGLGVVQFLIREGASHIIVTDLKDESRLRPTISKIPKRANIVYILGKHRLEDFENRDAILKNPDVPPASPFLVHARAQGIPIWSDISIFFDRVKTPIVGVTGTKGKSTTASLIAHILKTKYKKTFLAGNIRKSVLGIIDEANRADFVVLELSSFQLEDLHEWGKSPHIAVVTSLYPDHLNRHKTFAKYKQIKGYIAKFQKAKDIVTIPDKGVPKNIIRSSKSRRIIVRIQSPLRKKIVAVNPYLAGHMGNAALLAIAVANTLNVSTQDALSSLRTFTSLEGRIQKVRELRGVLFINDTTATAPAPAAIDLTLLAKEHHVILIAGGVDKQLPYDVFSDAIKRYATFVVFLPGSGTDKILSIIGKSIKQRMIMANSMRDAVYNAYKKAKSGDVVLLSPGGASFNLFLHEFHRGDEFKKEVNKLK